MDGVNGSSHRMGIDRPDLSAFLSAPHPSHYHSPPWDESAWDMADDEAAFEAAPYSPDRGYLAGDSPAWSDNNPHIAVEQAVQQLLDALGVDEKEHTAETPARVARAWHDMLWGYTEVPEDHLDTDLPAAEDPGLVVMHGIPFVSTCAHHLLPFSGTATIAYRPQPGQSVVGLSNLTRLVHGYAARLQLQERIGQQAAGGIMRKLNPSGAMCVITARHDCMRLGGEPAAEATTEARKGTWLDHELALVHRLHAGCR